MRTWRRCSLIGTPSNLSFHLFQTSSTPSLLGTTFPFLENATCTCTCTCVYTVRRYMYIHMHACVCTVHVVFYVQCTCILSKCTCNLTSNLTTSDPLNVNHHYIITLTLTPSAPTRVKFQDPAYPLDHVFSAVLLPNVRFPERVLRPGGNFHGPPGSYRPQLGFSSRGSNFTPSGPHGPGHRMIR